MANRLQGKRALITAAGARAWAAPPPSPSRAKARR